MIAYRGIRTVFRPLVRSVSYGAANPSLRRHALPNSTARCVLHGARCSWHLKTRPSSTEHVQHVAEIADFRKSSTDALRRAALKALRTMALMIGIRRAMKV